MMETQALVAPYITEIYPQTVTKETIRKKVWEHFRTHKIALFPGPYERIPHFKGADLAAQKLKELDVFQEAKFIEVNPDKPLEAARILVLESGKNLYVPIPKIEGCLFKKLELDGSIDVRRVVTRWGIDNTGKKIDVDDKIRIDLLVIGSVAVSKDGHRIGKGRGFADLEYALLKEMNAIDDDTVIVTLVHDSQVFDELPSDLFKKYDVPVNYIVTPTKVMKIENTLPKPTGVYWDVLTEKRVETIEVLKKLKKKYESEGKDTTLATVEENPGPRHYFRYRRFFRKKPKVEKSSNEPKSQSSGLKQEIVNTDNTNLKNSYRKIRSVKLDDDKISEIHTVAAPDIIETCPSTATKNTIRKKVWDHLNSHKISLFPGPYKKIPHFKEVEIATAKLKELEIFQNAKFIEVGPDKPLEGARILVLESGKDLYVPTHNIEGCLFKKLELVDNVDIRKVVTRWGIDNIGLKIGVEDKIHIDLLIIGSVAVSKDGHRIGKGKGFADLEFALLKEMNAIDDETIIITIVHDAQVFDSLPTDIFMKHDVPLDYIVTPSTVMKITPRLPRPTGVYWDILTEKRVGALDPLKKLKEKHESEGKDTTLATVEETKQTKLLNTVAKAKPRSKKSSPRFPQSKSSTLKFRNNADKENNRNIANNENHENVPSPLKKKKKKYRKTHSDYSLHVSNIMRSVRVSELKTALVEKGIRPNNITWKGYRGYCFLHYAKNNKKLKESSVEEPFAIDEVIEKIQQLKVNPDMKNLNVKVMEPITRIETMNITAV